MEVLNAALKYHKQGLSVIPCNRDKTPLVAWAEFQKRLATEEEIKEWFNKWPEANIAIVTGKLSNLTVLDCDSTEAIEAFRGVYKGDTVTVKTPRGTHYYFQYAEGTRNTVKINNLNLDLRSEGGYVLAPPSQNGIGHAYYFIKDFSITSLDSFSFYSLRGVDEYSSYKSSQFDYIKNIRQFSSMYFLEGRRDEDLFHVANCLVKSNCEKAMIPVILDILAKTCNPPYPEKDIDAKIKSALERANRRERNLVEEVLEVVNSSNGVFFSSDVAKILQLSSTQDLKNLSKIMSRLCEKEIIEKVGDKNGHWRLINTEYKEQQWWNDEGVPLKMSFPLGVEKFAKIYNGNIILLEGQKSQGKSQFAFEFCRLNKNVFPGQRIRYQNVEMADSEIYGRFKKYPPEVCTLEEWKKNVEIIKITENWWDFILPDGMNIVDYLVEYSEPFRLPDYMFKIHKRLKKGVALVIIQRDPYKPYPVGGRGVRDIPRLILSLIHHKIKLEDVKSYWDTLENNPTNLTRTYKQVNWWKFIGQDDWHMPEDDKYSGFIKER